MFLLTTKIIVATKLKTRRHKHMKQCETVFGRDRKHVSPPKNRRYFADSEVVMLAAFNCLDCPHMDKLTCWLSPMERFRRAQQEVKENTVKLDVHSSIQTDGTSTWLTNLQCADEGWRDMKFRPISNFFLLNKKYYEHMNEIQNMMPSVSGISVKGLG